MMEALAQTRAQSSEIIEIWRVAGLLHDLDYLRAPHDGEDRGVHESHPVPLVMTLRNLGYPPALTLSILEHSPHLDLEPSSQMSAALIACDEAATLCAFGEDISTIDGVPQSVIYAIPLAAEKDLEGRRRSNIRQRMLLNFERMNAPASNFAVRI
jgi:predicted hydrolase (HD superfamily)